MVRKTAITFLFWTLLFSVPAFEQVGSAADVVTNGDLAVQGVIESTGGVKFPDASIQTSACSGCANGILPISLGGTGGATAADARVNLGVPGLSTPNTFTAGQTIQGDLTTTGNINLPATTATTGVISSGGATLIHGYGTNNFFAGLFAGNLTMAGDSNTGIGARALVSNTDGAYNTATGSSALFSNTTAGYNTAVGSFALYSQSFSNGDSAWSSYNTAVGIHALFSNQPTSTTNGYLNTAVGSQALSHNTTGSSNTASGHAALFFNTTAGMNTAVGTSAMYTQSFDNAGVTYASHNTALGFQALYSNQPTTITNGNNNTALGSRVLYFNTTGFANTASGTEALYNNNTGGYNTASGVISLTKNTDGSFNTASGFAALSSNKTGWNNTALGYFAGDTSISANANTTGSNNTFIGAYSGPGTTTQLTNATAIGYNAHVSQSNSLVLGGTGVDAVKVGIGTTTPNATLDVTNLVRVLGVTATTWPTTGKGLELAYNSSANTGYIQAYDRGGAGLWGALNINAADVYIGGAPGNLHVAGTLSKGAGSFKIDHPLDPQNKYLYHSFVESPDMMNIYNGNVTTDDQGYATVVLPDWFNALNRDCRYQLTVIGQFAQAIIEKKIENNRFTIRTDKPAVEVSWQVTGIRQDAYAEAHRIQVEETKPAAEQGTCLHPEACR